MTEMQTYRLIAIANAANNLAQEVNMHSKLDEDGDLVCIGCGVRALSKHRTSCTVHKLEQALEESEHETWW